jgi:membrane protein
MRIYSLARATLASFVEDEALTRGAAIAFYTVTTIGPLLLIVVSIAGVFFGEDAARGAVVGQLSNLLGTQSAEFFQSILAHAVSKSAGLLSSLVGAAALLVSATGVFGEMQSALNAIWKVEARSSALSRLMRARILSLGLVVVLGFLLMVSLVVSAMLVAFGVYLQARFPAGSLILAALNAGISFGLITVLFGAIFKVLPDRHLEWKDVVLGGVVSALLFSAGKFLIAWYLATSGVASSYGAAGAVILLLLWVYYSAQIFLFGAELTKAYANARGSHAKNPVVEKSVVKL